MLIDLVPRKEPHGRVEDKDRWEGVDWEKIKVQTKDHHKYDATITMGLRAWLSNIAYAHDFESVAVFVSVKCSGVFLAYKFERYSGPKSNRGEVKHSVLEHLKEKLNPHIELRRKWKDGRPLELKLSLEADQEKV